MDAYAFGLKFTHGIILIIAVEKEESCISLGLNFFNSNSS
jgi:hypothetical protein